MRGDSHHKRVDPDPTYEALWQLGQADPEITTEVFRSLARSDNPRLREAAAFLVDVVIDSEYSDTAVDEFAQLKNDPDKDVRGLFEASVYFSHLTDDLELITVDTIRTPPPNISALSSHIADVLRQRRDRGETIILQREQ